MTHKEAYEILHPDTTAMKIAEIEYKAGFNAQEAGRKAVEEACLVACEAILNLDLYESIGTQEECRTAVERMKPRKWIEEDMGSGDTAWKCPACNEYWALMEGTPKFNDYNFCPKCGCRLEE